MKRDLRSNSSGDSLDQKAGEGRLRGGQGENEDEKSRDWAGV